jgi:hypothetical protein
MGDFFLARIPKRIYLFDTHISGHRRRFVERYQYDCSVGQISDLLSSPSRKNIPIYRNTKSAL